MPVVAIPTAAAVGQSLTAAKYNELVTFTSDDSGWIQVTTFLLGWTATTAVYYRRRLGIVYLRGQLTGGTSGTVFTLPTGYLPAASTAFFVVYSSGTTTVTSARVSISSAGAVGVNSGLTPALDSINFVADA